MEHYKISELLNDSIGSRFAKRKQIEVNNLVNIQYFSNKSIRFKTPMVRSDLCDYSDLYIDVKGTIIVADTNANNGANKILAFKNNAPFRSCILKSNRHIQRQCRRSWYCYANV